MPPNNFGIWTPRMTMKSFRAWSHAPRTTTYVPSPPPQTVRKRTPTELSDDMVPDLMARMQEWNGEVARLEREVESFEPSNLKDHLAFHMFSGKIKNHERFWDPKGDGSITVGDFRMQVRSLGLTRGKVPNEEIDATFAEWDADGSGTITMQELFEALRQLRNDWTRRQGKEVLQFVGTKKHIEVLRRRAQAAADAIAAHDATKTCAAELAELTNGIETDIRIQLGGLLTRRKIKAGEIVVAWQGARPLPKDPKSPRSLSHSPRLGAVGSPRVGAGASPRRLGAGTDLAGEHRDEITKREFASGVEKLELLVGQHPVTAASLSALFDEIDSDQSGFLDMKEAKRALKAWQAEGKVQYDAKTAKMKELGRLRVRATTKLQEAIREPEAAGSDAAALPLPGMGSSVELPSPQIRMGRQTLFVRRSSAARAEKSALSPTERAHVQANHAARILKNIALSRGWGSWRNWYDERARRLLLIERTLRYLSKYNLGCGYRQWAEWLQLTLWMRELLTRAATQLALLEEARVFRTWLHRAAEEREGHERERRARRAVAAFQNPQLLSAFDFWLRDAGLDAESRARGRARGNKQPHIAPLGSGGGGALAHCLRQTGLHQALVCCLQQRHP